MKIWTLALAGLLAWMPTHVCAQAGPPGYPTITAAQVQPTGDMVQLYGTRFVYNTFLTMQQLQAFVALQNGAIGAGTAGQIPFYAAAGKTLTAQGPFTTGSSIIGAGTGGLSSVGPFTAGMPIIGAGTSGLAAGGRSGSTTTFGTTNGTLSNGHCASFDSNGNIIDAGAACATGTGSGTVSAGLATQFAQYPSNGTTVAGVYIACPPIPGVVGDGTTDNLAAVTTALTALGSNSGCLSFPAGKFLMSTSISYTFPAATQTVTIKGAGQDATTLYWPNLSNGFGVTYNTLYDSFNLYNMALTTAQHGGSSAIVLSWTGTETYRSQLPYNNIQNVSIHGDDGFNISDYWQNGVVIQSVGGVNLINDQIVGAGKANPSNGVGLLGTSSAIGIVYNLINTSCQYYQTCLDYGSDIQGVTISGGSNFIGCQTGIFQPGGAAADAQLAVIGSQFDCDTDIGLTVGMAGTIIQGDYFIGRVGGDIGIQITGDFNFTISGNYFEGEINPASSNIRGINLGSLTSGTGGTITNNVFNNLQYGVGINTGTDFVNASGNTFVQTTTPFPFFAAIGAHSRITDNIGYNPVGLAGASTVSGANICAGPSRETHYLRQTGSFNGIVFIAGNQIGQFTSASDAITINLEPNECFSTTWTTSPISDLKQIH